MILIYIQMEIKPIKVIVIVVKSDIDKKKSDKGSDSGKK